MGAVLDFPTPSKGIPTSEEILRRLIIKIQRETGIEWERLKELTDQVLEELVRDGFKVE